MDINPGDTLTEANIEFKRPGTGISPADLNSVIGRKVNKAIVSGTIVQISDFT